MSNTKGEPLLRNGGVVAHIGDPPPYNPADEPIVAGEPSGPSRPPPEERAKAVRDYLNHQARGDLSGRSHLA